jgi:hypothetical protein
MLRESSEERSSAMPIALRKPMGSSASLRPVGIDVLFNQPTAEQLEARDARRRGLQRIVVGTVGVCGVILVAAIGTQVARASAGPSPSVVAAKLSEVPPPSSETAAAGNGAGAAAAAGGHSAAPVGVGKVRLRWPAVPGHVWLDGEKMVASWETVSCGKHEIRVGTHGHAHSIDVPCGDELKVSR